MKWTVEDHHDGINFPTQIIKDKGIKVAEVFPSLRETGRAIQKAPEMRELLEKLVDFYFGIKAFQELNCGQVESRVENMAFEARRLLEEIGGKPIFRDEDGY